LFGLLTAAAVKMATSAASAHNRAVFTVTATATSGWIGECIVPRFNKCTTIVVVGFIGTTRHFYRTEGADVMTASGAISGPSRSTTLTATDYHFEKSVLVFSKESIMV